MPYEFFHIWNYAVRMIALSTPNDPSPFEGAHGVFNGHNHYGFLGGVFLI